MPGPPTAGFSHWGSSHRQWQTPAAGLGKQQLTARSGVACDGAALTSGGSGGVRPTASGKSPTASQRRPSATGHSQSRVPQQRPGTVGVRGPPPQVANLQWQANVAQAPPATARAGCHNTDPAPWEPGGRHRKWQISNDKPTSPKRHRPQPEPGATTEPRHRGSPGAATASGKSPMASQRRPSATGHSQSRVRQRRPGTVGVRGPSRRQWQNQPEPRSWGSGGRPAASGKTNPSPGRGGPGAVPPPVAKPTRAPVVGVRGPSRRQWQNQPEPRSWGSGGRPAASGKTNPYPNPDPGRGGSGGRPAASGKTNPSPDRGGPGGRPPG